MNRFKAFSLIEKHTLGSALVNSSRAITKGSYEIDAPSLKAYGEICIDDNDALLAELNESIKEHEQEDN